MNEERFLKRMVLGISKWALAIACVLIVAGCDVLLGPFKESEIPSVLDRDEFIRAVAAAEGLQIQSLGSGGSSGRGRYPAITKRKIGVAIVSGDVSKLFPQISEEIRRTVESYQAKIYSSIGNAAAGNVSYKYKWAANHGFIEIECKATSPTEAEIDLFCKEQR